MVPLDDGSSEIDSPYFAHFTWDDFVELAYSNQVRTWDDACRDVSLRA